MLFFLTNPIVISFGCIIGLLLVLAFDLLQSCSRYLYFTTEIGIVLMSLVVYLAAFKGKKWSDAPEPEDDDPQPNWRPFARDMAIGFCALGLVLVGVWIAKGMIEDMSARQWLKRGAWFAYYIGVFGVSVFIIRKYLRYVHGTALVVATIIMTFFLTTYEMVLLANGTGWEYNNTVIGWLLGVPLDNILFIYPVAPALAMILYAMVTRHVNDLKAFWRLNLILVPCSIVVELVGIYPLNLWRIFNDDSILPMGKTNLEEFLYYILFQFLSIALYVFLKTNFVRRTAISSRNVS